MSQKIEQWKAVLQDSTASQKKKATAVRGLIVAGISQTAIKAWMLRGAENGPEISKLKWNLSIRSGAPAWQRKRSVERLLELGISSEQISRWAQE